MICTTREAYDKDCCVFDKLCVGENCMGWIQIDGLYACGSCASESNTISKAQQCCDNDVFMTKGYCGRNSNV